MEPKFITAARFTRGFSTTNSHCDACCWWKTLKFWKQKMKKKKLNCYMWLWCLS